MKSDRAGATKSIVASSSQASGLGGEPRFREITGHDIPALFHVRTRTRENAYTLDELHGLGITVESVGEKLAGSFKGWLCADADRVVAFCMADRATGELWVVAALPEYEGRGIGNTLMRLAEEWLAATGWTRAWLTTDIDTTLRAYGFYRQRGWTDWKIDNGVRWMELPLPGPSPRDDPSPSSPRHIEARDCP